MFLHFNTFGGCCIAEFESLSLLGLGAFPDSAGIALISDE